MISGSFAQESGIIKIQAGIPIKTTAIIFIFWWFSNSHPIIAPLHPNFHTIFAYILNHVFREFPTVGFQLLVIHPVTFPCTSGLWLVSCYLTFSTVFFGELLPSISRWFFPHSNQPFLNGWISHVEYCGG